MKCQYCDSQKITYYKQKIKSGRFYVTARCENGHSPIKGKPFYPVEQFNLDELPILKKIEDETEVQQENFFDFSPSKKIKEIWQGEEIKKYPRQPIPKSNGRNVLIPIETDEEK